MIREENPADVSAIGATITAAFETAPHSDGTESTIVERLRAEKALTVSLVAEEDGVLVGHIAFSPVRINGSATGWYGLGPLAVRPDRQRQGTGSRLVEAGLDAIIRLGARGCVVLGDPAYYARFGFANEAALLLPGVPAEYFQCLRFDGDDQQGTVSYHAAFYPG